MPPSVNRSLEVVGVLPRGRPTLYDEQMAGEICALLWEGRSLTSICADEDMPSLRTVYQWMDRHPDFMHDYHVARARQAFTHNDEIQDIADDRSILPDRAKVMIDARKWKAAKQNWRYFGDKVQVETKEASKELTPDDIPGGLGFLARARIGRDEK